MSVSEQIYEEVKKLPEPLQAEVLDFVEHLASKEKREIAPESELASAGLSLSLAMRGMENEDTPSYSTEDLREVF
jgi:Protein of unknown function (DUF2281)